MPQQQPADQAAETDYAERIAALETQLANAQRAAARAPFLLVPANGGGPGNDNHQPSWSQAEQEIAQRGEWLDTWTGDQPA